MKRMLSGIKPTGRLHLGNYIGAISQFAKYQDEYELFIFIANEHAITIPIEAKDLRKNTRDLIALYLACGLDPEKVTLFLQSDVEAHAKLGWIMTCMAYMGEMQRMTQYKDKTAKGEKGVTAGLFTYPALMAADILLYDPDFVPVGQDQKQHVELTRNLAERFNHGVTAGLFTYPALMAADILLYDPDFVPVGQDQKQHVELTRNLAERFNHRYSDTFKIPEPLSQSVGQKVYSLTDPTKKMSKSESNPRGTIDLLDDPAQARNKIRSAVTDSLGVVRYDPQNQPGVSNLLTIQSVLSGEPVEDIVARYEGKGYGELKKEVGETVFTFLTDLQARYRKILDEKIVDKVLEEGAARARKIADKKISKVYRKVGFTI